MTTEAGSIGARLDLNVRAGDTLGPFVATVTDTTTGAAIDLTGCTFEGAVSKLDDADGDQAMTCTIVDAAAGKVQFKYTATEAMGGADADFFKASAAYSWYLKMTDSAGTKQTLLYGQVKVAAENPT